MPFDNVKNILVIKLRHIGDVLLTVPVFRALRQTFPDAHMAALVNSGTDGVLSGNPLIDEILLMDRGIKKLPKAKQYLKEMAFLRAIRARRFDMTVDLTGGDRAAIISLISGARYRLGVRSQKGFLGKKYLYTHLSGPEGKRHTVFQDLEVTGQFGINTEDLSVDFHIPEEDTAFIRQVFSENNITGQDTLVHVHPTSRWLFKCWKDEYIAAVINRMSGMGMKVVVTSSPDKKEIEKTRNVLSLVSSRVIDLTGRTTLKQLAAVSKASALFFGVDSAPMHIAAALGTPVIALFGPSGAFHWGPWDNNQNTEVTSERRGSGSQESNTGQQAPYPKRNGVQAFGRHIVIQRDWDCIPCGKDGCNGSKISKCLEDIKPEEIITLLEQRLKDMAK